MTPLLVLLFGVDPARAVGTDLLFACVTKGAGMTFHSFRGSVDWRIVGRLAAGSVPASALTLYLVGGTSHTRHAHGDVITTTLGFALILTATGTTFRRRIVGRLAPVVEAMGDRARSVLTIGLGAVLGALV